MTITPTTLFRAAGVAAALAGLIFIGVQINHPHLDATSITTTDVITRNSLKMLMAALALAGITGLYLHQVTKLGVLGLLGYLLFAAGYLSMLGTEFVAALVLPSIAHSATVYVNSVIAVANNGATGDVAGNRLNNAPEWAGRYWIEWNGDIGRARRLSISADATAQSTVFYTPFNDDIQRQSAYGLLGARIEYGPSDRRWALAAYARNLTGTEYITAAFGTVPTAFGGRPGAPRQFSVEFRVQR